MEDCELSDDLVATAARDQRYGAGTHHWQSWQGNRHEKLVPHGNRTHNTQVT